MCKYVQPIEMIIWKPFWGDTGHLCMTGVIIIAWIGSKPIHSLVSIRSSGSSASSHSPPKRYLKKLKWRWSRRIHENLVCSTCSDSGEWSQLREQKKIKEEERKNWRREKKTQTLPHPLLFFCSHPFAQSPRLHKDISYLKQVTSVIRLLSP